jgi:tetratricopeptide (TPR) repeat protein
MTIDAARRREDDNMFRSWTISRHGLVTLIVACVSATGVVFSQDPLARVSEQERALIKEIREARDAYQASLERLRAFYVHENNIENLRLVERELTDYHLMIKHPYLLELDLPSADLKPDTVIPNANRIFVEAQDWLNRASLTDRDGNYKRAELLFRRLLRDYPRSDKLDETCYYLGDIYSSKYFQQYRRAVAFYERVWHYEPTTNLDARLKAGMVYETYISDHRRAIELYQEVLRRETDRVQTDKARRRLDLLLNARGSSRAY